MISSYCVGFDEFLLNQHNNSCLEEDFCFNSTTIRKEMFRQEFYDYIENSYEEATYYIPIGR